MQALIAPQPRRVLVVEDEWLLREMLAEALDEAGYATSMVFSVADALRKLRQPIPIDLVIADMDLPDAEDGRDLAAFLALERPKSVFSSCRCAVRNRCRMARIFCANRFRQLCCCMS